MNDLVLSAFLGFIILTSNAFAEKPNQVTVNLFGQSCTLSGPFSQATLKAVHELSPANIPPLETDSDALKIDSIFIKNEPLLPPALKPYSKKVRTYVEAHHVFFGALTEYLKSKDNSSKATNSKADPRAKFLTTLKPFQLPSFENQFAVNFSKNNAQTNILLERFQESIEPLPEELFHKTISKAAIVYHCTYDEKNGAAADEEAD